MNHQTEQVTNNSYLHLHQTFQAPQKYVTFQQFKNPSLVTPDTPLMQVS